MLVHGIGFAVLEEMLSILLSEILKAEHAIAIETRTFHDPSILEYVSSDNGTTIRTGPSDDTHC
jgi:hypothetical protein